MRHFAWICFFLSHLSWGTLELVQDPSLALQMGRWYDIRTWPDSHGKVQEVELFQNPDPSAVPSPGGTRLIGVNFGLALEVPVLPWFNSGFFFHYNRIFDDNARQSDMSGPQAYLFDLGAIIKFPFSMPVFSSGYVAPYVGFPVGFSTILNLANGVGVSGKALGGIEFFPIRYGGLYVEGGYQAYLLRIQNLFSRDFRSISIGSAFLYFGIKLAI